MNVSVFSNFVCCRRWYEGFQRGASLRSSSCCSSGVWACQSELGSRDDAEGPGVSDAESVLRGGSGRVEEGDGVRSAEVATRGGSRGAGEGGSSDCIAWKTAGCASTGAATGPVGPTGESGVHGADRDVRQVT